jgi:hypothetical protein
MWKNTGETDRPWMVWCTCIACCIPKTTDTYVILFAFQQQQQFHEHTSMLCLYIHCLSCNIYITNLPLYIYDINSHYCPFLCWIPGDDWKRLKHVGWLWCVYTLLNLITVLLLEYIYIYMCVCVCVCVWKHQVCGCKNMFPMLSPNRAHYVQSC